MFKKIFLILLLFFSLIGFSNVLAVSGKTIEEKRDEIKSELLNVNSEIKKQNEILKNDPENNKARNKLEDLKDSKTGLLQSKVNTDPKIVEYNIAKDNLQKAKIDKIRASNTLTSICKKDKCTQEQKNSEEYKNAYSKYETATDNLKSKSAEIDDLKTKADASVKDINTEIENTNDQKAAAKKKYDESDEAKGDVNSVGFEINVSDISPGQGTAGGTTKENVNLLLSTLIQNLMIALGSIALLVMVIGAGYIVLHHGQDEILSKGKTIFMSGVYALIVALSAYYLVNIVRFLLYQGS